VESVTRFQRQAMPRSHVGFEPDKTYRRPGGRNNHLVLATTTLTGLVTQPVDRAKGGVFAGGRTVEALPGDNDRLVLVRTIAQDRAWFVCPTAMIPQKTAIEGKAAAG